MGPVHNISAGVVETQKRDASGNLITRRTLPSHEIPWVTSAERLVSFDEAATLMQLEGINLVNDLPPPSNDMRDPLAVDVNAEDDWDFQDIPASGAIDVQFSLPGNFSAIQEKFHLYG